MTTVPELFTPLAAHVNRGGVVSCFVVMENDAEVFPATKVPKVVLM